MGGVPGYTLDRSPVNRRATQTHTGQTILMDHRKCLCQKQDEHPEKSSLMSELNGAE